MGQFEMKYPSEASCAVSEVSLPLQDYFRNVEEESSAALRKEVFRFFHFYRGYEYGGAARLGGSRKSQVVFPESVLVLSCSLFWRCSRRIPASLLFWAVFRSNHKNRRRTPAASEGWPHVSSLISSRQIVTKSSRRRKYESLKMF